MIDMARDFAEAQTMPIRIGVSCGLGAVPAWKYDADAWYLQVSYDLDAIVTWRACIRTTSRSPSPLGWRTMS